MARFMFLNDAAATSTSTGLRRPAKSSACCICMPTTLTTLKLTQLVGELSVNDRDFRRWWWSDQDVYRPSFGSKRYRHPLVGELTLGFEAFTPVGDIDQTLGLYTVEPGSPSEHAPRMLASRRAQPTMRLSHPMKAPSTRAEANPSRALSPCPSTPVAVYVNNLSAEGHSVISRREFGQLAGMTAAAVSLAGCSPHPRSTHESGTTHASFESLKQVDAGLLNVGYAESMGSRGGQPVILLHGWPYDIHSYVDVAPALAQKGYRVIVQFLREYGTTTFRSRVIFPQRTTICRGTGCHRVDGYAADTESRYWRLRLGLADRRYRCGALARTVQGAHRRERLPDYQPTGQPQTAAARSRIRMVVPVLSVSVHQPRSRRHRHPQLPMAT